MKTVYRFLGVLLMASLMVACSSWGEKQDVTRSWSAQKLYNEGKASMGNGDYETAIDYYEKLESRYPFGPLAEQSQLEIAYAYFKYDEPASAIAAADRFIKLHPRHGNVDYAYYIKGLANFTKGESFLDRFVPRDVSQNDTAAALAAFRDFEELTSRFPDSRYSKDATQRMLFLRNVLARHEINVAEYYLSRDAFVAAANRAKFVVENYQRTPSVPDALVIMAKAYRHMGLDDLAQDAVRVLRLNFPENPGLVDVMSYQVP